MSAERRTYHDDDLERLIQHRMDEAIDAGHPPKNVPAWKAAARRTELENERDTPGFIARAAGALRVSEDGKRITYWTETRGTHGIDWIYSPTGTDHPPRDQGYSLDIAKADYDARQRRLRIVP